MPARPHIGLDNPAFRNRLRQPAYQANPKSRPKPKPDLLTDYIIREHERTGQAQVQEPIGNNKSFAQQSAWLIPGGTSTSLLPANNMAALALGTVVAAPQLGASEAEAFSELELEPFEESDYDSRQLGGSLQRRLERLLGNGKARQLAVNLRHSRLQLTLVGIAGLVFLLGLTISLQTWQANNNAAAQVTALSKQLVQAASNSNQIISAPAKAKTNR